MVTNMREAAAWAKVTREEQGIMLAPFLEAISKLKEIAETRKAQLTAATAQLSIVTGERDYARNRVHTLGPLAQLVLGEERLPDNNLDLQSLVAAYFRTAVSTTPESAMKPVLEMILSFLSPPEQQPVVAVTPPPVAADLAAPASVPATPVLPQVGQDLGPLKGIAPS